MLKMLNSLRSVISEIGILFILLFSINNFIGYEQVTINADGVGYYDPLPAMFIYHDLPHSTSDVVSERIKKMDFYVLNEGKRMDKYHCGTALLISPFFAVANFMAPSFGYAADGYSFPYQRAVFIAALFYLFFALIFLRKTLQLFAIEPRLIFFVELLAVLATPIFHYVNRDASYSHVFSFFAINAFIYFAASFFLHQNKRAFFYCCLLFGLIVIIRPVNGIIIFFLPFLAGSFSNFKEAIKKAFGVWQTIVLGMTLFLGMVFIQCLLWYYQTGHWFRYGYVGETFNFLSPAFADFLFSYRKGVFVYTPVLLLVIPALILFFRKGELFRLFSWLLFFVLVIYVLSSWWVWFYGGSFGSRPFIDFYAIPFIAIAWFMQNMNNKFKWIVISLSLLCIPVNIIQARQYNSYILSWANMDKEKYWSVFLREEDRFKGLFFKDHFFIWEQKPDLIYSDSVHDHCIEAEKQEEIYSLKAQGIAGFERVNLIRIQFENEFNIEDDTRLQLLVLDSCGKLPAPPVNGFAPGDLVFNIYQTGYLIHHWARTPLIQFNESGMDQYQMGEYDFLIPPIKKEGKIKIVLQVITKDKRALIKNLKISYHEYKK